MFHGLALSWGYEDGSDFSPLSESIITPTLDFNPNGIFLGYSLFPQSRVRVSLESYSKDFAFGLGFVPQSIVVSSPYSPRSLVSWL